MTINQKKSIRFRTQKDIHLKVLFVLVNFCSIALPRVKLKPLKVLSAKHAEIFTLNRDFRLGRSCTLLPTVIEDLLRLTTNERSYLISVYIDFYEYLHTQKRRSNLLDSFTDFCLKRPYLTGLFELDEPNSQNSFSGLSGEKSNSEKNASAENLRADVSSELLLTAARKAKVEPSSSSEINSSEDEPDDFSSLEEEDVYPVAKPEQPKPQAAIASDEDFSNLFADIPVP